MVVLVDSTIWSLALRRPSVSLSCDESLLVREWSRLIAKGTARIIGPIRQEVLSGVRDADTFRRIEDALGAFEDLSIETTDYVRAAAFYNKCRAHGVAGTHNDLLLCAISHREDAPVFTTDADFTRYARHLPIRVHEVSDTHE